ncbi:MAG: ABC transporter permease [Oscillospiraceae bacterium]|nr:ABC transporter permease [Oscillospiraceae bacterium]
MRALLNVLVERRDFFARLTLEHLLMSAIAIVIAAVIGLGLGILIAEFRKASPLVLGITSVVYTIPSISMFGFLISVTGIGNKTAIIAMTIYALLPMVRNTYAGIGGVSPEIIEAATGMGSTRLQILLKIKIPMAIAYILTGLRSMVVMTISVGGIASFIGAGGLGVAIYRGIATNKTELTVAGSLLIAVLALLADFIFSRLEKYMKGKWKVT